ncbi:MAG: hypothetical protein OXH46_11110 [Gemmatimonadetes bacterium]|nr:hypothetical protein [Gemmatimonadota bacterium]
MLRRLVASLLPLLVAAPLMAQTMVGIRAGLNRATFSAFVEEELLELENLGGATSEDPRMGAIAGIDVAFPLASAVELRLGGAYAQKGYSLSVSGLGGRGFTGFEMDYLQFSALARVGSARDGPVSVGVLLGPWMAYRVSCQLSVDFDVEGFGSIRESGSCSADGAKIDLGVAAGAAWNWRCRMASAWGWTWCTHSDSRGSMTTRTPPRTGVSRFRPAS